MAFYGDVTPGDEFRPSAALSNDIRHFLNGLNGFGGNPFGANGAGTVRIQAYNATGGEIRAGTAVNFDESKRMSGDAVPMKAFSDPGKPWGVVTQRLADKEVGDCFISGPVTVALAGSGDYAQPTAGNPSVFTRGAEGAPVLYGNGGRGVINLGAGTPENYDGPFAIAYDSEARKLKVKAGYLTRNGEFLSVPEAELEPQTGTVCVKTVLEGGEWSEPEILFESPSQFCYPVGHARTQGDGEEMSVSVCSYRVPVAVILAARICSEEND
ncbi:MAG: hypothetical protein IKP01_10580 [Bacteroidales bacterium]|nr:hypothetical protein [Bacteroidales bacterium]